MMISIEIPVIRGGWLMQCIDSVLQQTSANWRLSLYWDQGDNFSRQILQEIEKAGHPGIQTIFGQKRLGISKARQLLTQHSQCEWVLPLDDDDILLPEAVARFLQTIIKCPWAGIIRAKREFIDELGDPVLMDDWFTFERRKYFKGATCDISNHSQPYIFKRELFLKTGGWKGYEDYEYIGGDCNCFMQMEEVSEIELLDEILYQYRIHKRRTSLQYKQDDADELWRRITDESIQRRGAGVKRVNNQPPFRYVGIPGGQPKISDVEAVIPFHETNEYELTYAASRPAEAKNSSFVQLGIDNHFSQNFNPLLKGFNRIEFAISTVGSFNGVLSVAFFNKSSSFSPAVILKKEIISADPLEFEFISMNDTDGKCRDGDFSRMEVVIEPSPGRRQEPVFLHTVNGNASEQALIRLFAESPGHCRKVLERCISSLLITGIQEDSIHVIEKVQSSAANRNEAFRECSGPWICFIDDDVEIINPDTLEILLNCMTESDAGLCGPKLLTPSGRLYSGIPFTDPLTLEARVGGMGEIDKGQYDINTFVPWLPSTLLMIHHSVMLSTGGFDENFVGSQHEDVDFSLRARARGFQCFFAGKTAVIHHNRLRNGYFSKNMQYLKKKWMNRKDLFLWPADAQKDMSRKAFF